MLANGEQNNIIPIELTLVSPALQPEEFQKQLLDMVTLQRSCVYAR